MEDKFVICDNCGTKCDANAKFCKVCSSTLADATVQPVIPGIEDAKLFHYIGKNANHYMEKFAKKKGKWFIQINFAALLFGPTWFFYRKMRKIAILYAAILLLSNVLLSVVLPVAFHGDVERYFAAREAYSDYINSGRECYIYKDPPYSSYIKDLHPDYREVRDELAQAQSRIRLVNWLITIPVLIVNILVRLFANSIYKNHITQNISDTPAGVSMKSALLGWLAVTAATYVAAFLLSLIPHVCRFVIAVDTIISYI